MRIAQDLNLCLVPADITWEQFCNFTSDLGTISDQDVSLRYAYGEIQLSRLNFYAPLLLRKSYFQRVEYQYGTYFARFFGAILFIICIMSVALNGLQVVVSVEQGDVGSWIGLARWVSAMIILTSCRPSSPPRGSVHVQDSQGMEICNPDLSSSDEGETTNDMALA